MKQANVLFVTLEGGGNVAPVLGLARRLIGRGHSVTILSEPCLESLITEMGAAFAPFGAHFTRTDRKADLFQDWNASKVNNPVFERVMLGPAPTVIDRCIEVIQARSIDLLFTDVLLFPGIIAAEYTGIPSVIVSHMPEFLPGPNRPPGNMGLKPGKGLLYRLRDKVFAKLMNAKFDEYKAMLNDKRARLGLPPLQHTLDLFHRADLRLIQTIEAFDTPLSPRPQNVRYTGPELDDPDWAAAETQASLWPDESGQPLVVVSFSSTFQNQAGAIQNCIDALSGLPVRGCVTLGPAMEDEGFRAADNVRLLKSVPHSRLFPQADLVITHGGHGTLMRALANGLPLICMPMGRDQDDNAVKVAMKGCGLKVSPKASPARIRKAVQQVLGNGQYATAAKGLQEAIRKQSGPEEAIAEVDALMAARQGAVGKTA